MNLANKYVAIIVLDQKKHSIIKSYYLSPCQGER